MVENVDLAPIANYRALSPKAVNFDLSVNERAWSYIFARARASSSAPPYLCPCSYR